MAMIVNNLVLLGFIVPFLNRRVDKKIWNVQVCALREK